MSLNLKHNPYEQFHDWFSEYKNTNPIEPNAMTLATASPDGHPSARVVLLKSFDENGLTFYTNYESTKSRHLSLNNKVEVVFHWDTLHRQVRIQGLAERVSQNESNAYFQTRPYMSQIGAWASKQSRELESREKFEKLIEDFKVKFPEGHVPLPPHWGGWRISVTRFEFWQGRDNRLHDRFYYLMTEGGWKIQRLFP